MCDMLRAHHILGAVLRRWHPVKVTERCDLEVVIHANCIRINNEQRASIAITAELASEYAAFWASHAGHPLAGRNEILAAFCPQVFGLYVVKLGEHTSISSCVLHSFFLGTTSFLRHPQMLILS